MKESKEKSSVKARTEKAKGITLIALVITIIVLLILAGVTIATLTGENGILTRASDASRENEIASVKEQAQLDISNWIAEELENGRDATISDWEEIKNILDTANPDAENRYYTNVTEEGIETPSGYLVPIDEFYTNGSSEEETVLKTVEDLVAGDKVYYDTGNPSVGNQGIIECTVLYDKAYNEVNGTNYGVQIISSDVIKTTDGTVATVILGDSDFNTSRESYNNALKTLYNEAQKYLNPTYASGARCVGSDPADPDWDTTTNEAGYLIKNEGEDDYYAYMKDYYGTLKNEDTKYNTDWTQMGTIADIKTASTFYWLASRRVFSGSSFFVRNVNSSGYLSSNNLCIVYSGGYADGYSSSNGIRPVFTLNSEIKVTEGDGETTPYTLAT